MREVDAISLATLAAHRYYHGLEVGGDVELLARGVLILTGHVQVNVDTLTAERK